MPKILRKMVGISIIVGIAYGVYKLMEAVADTLCEEECQKMAKPAQTKASQKKPIRKKKK